MGILPRRQEEMIRQPERQDETIHRQAGALAEVQRIHADNMVMLDKIEQDRRTIERLEDRCTLLNAELSKSQQEGKVYQRKLIRLAAAMSGIGRLTQDAVEIMRSCQEWQETEQERSDQGDQKTAAEIIESLPSRES